MGIRLIDPKVVRALMEVTYHPKMIALALWYAWRNNTPVITSAYRPKKVHDKDSGIHMTIPCRALDWESHNLSNPEKVVEDINNHWEYDPKRPHLKCAIYHDVGLGKHIHTQVHENTVFHVSGRQPEEVEV